VKLDAVEGNGTNGKENGMASVATFISARALVNDSRLEGSKVLRDMIELRVNQLLAMVLLALLAPMLLVVMVLIWQVDGAPILFGHYRVGKNGRLFRCLKFRSMRRDAAHVLAELLQNDPDAAREWKRDHKLTNDPRITPIGNFLRRTSLDELPQLLNVIRGDMHLVGPRPVTVAELEKYGNSRWHYVSVKPGMTGLWQVSGRNNTSYEERVALDRHYVESQSMAFDAAILLKTVKVVLFREGAR
jgi:lipopolysaccharide/colanic/teichoic acid biosynthesis glycosyltransferase